jgi:hypothetical protein
MRRCQHILLKHKQATTDAKKWFLKSVCGALTSRVRSVRGSEITHLNFINTNFGRQQKKPLA